ncbi:hypothetical protein DWW13_04910 [Blautia sp. AF14-40]|nr:hypothetical protein DWW13_04910 [Blautia sp. AF14-40]
MLDFYVTFLHRSVSGKSFPQSAEFFSAAEKEAAHRFSGVSCLLFCFLFCFFFCFFFRLLIFL